MNRTHPFPRTLRVLGNFLCILKYMNHFERPPHVREAIKNSDKETLSAAGKRGAEKTNEIREVKKLLGNEQAEIQLRDAAMHEEALLEHVPEDDR